MSNQCSKCGPFTRCKEHAIPNSPALQAHYGPLLNWCDKVEAESLQAALERALAFDEKAVKGREWWLSNYNYYGHALSSDIRYAYSKDKLSQLDEGCSREGAIHVVEKASVARLAPIHAAMLKVIELVEKIESGEITYYEKDHQLDGKFTPSYFDLIREVLEELRKTLDGVK
jgi:hypothetical protein